MHMFKFIPDFISSKNENVCTCTYPFERALVEGKGEVEGAFRLLHS